MWKDNKKEGKLDADTFRYKTQEAVKNNKPTEAMCTFD
jgi:hypothetical protein